MVLQPVTHRSLVDEVFDQVQRQILRGELAPGQAMPSERDLIGVLGVNRQAVREALKRLAQAGLVDIQHGGRTTVTDWRYSGSLDLLPRLVVGSNGSIDVAVVRSIMEFRALVGPDVAAWCAERATADVVARLHELQQRYESVDAETPLVDVALLDTEMWNALVDGADNIAYRLAYNALHAQYVTVEDALRDVLRDELMALDARRRLMTDVLDGKSAAARAEAHGLLSIGTAAVASALAALTASSSTIKVRKAVR